MSNAKKHLLLLVEDDFPIAGVLGRYLEKEGFVLLRAPDGLQGLKLAFKHHPDLILLDIVMPKMDGLTMLKKLREDSWGKKVAVIILSNLSHLESERVASQYNVKEYIIKTDLTMSGIVKRIREIF